MLSLYSLSYPDPVQVWETAHTGEINVIEWNGEGQVLASASADTKLKLWREASPEPIGVFAEHTEEVYQVCVVGIFLHIVVGETCS